MFLQPSAPDLLEPPPQPVPGHAGFPALEHDQAEAGMTRLVGCPANVDVGPAQTASSGQHTADFGGADQPVRARKALATVRRVRASNLRKRSTASGPSSCDATERHDPSGRPYATGSRAWQSGACSAGDMLASSRYTPSNRAGQATGSGHKRSRFDFSTYGP